ncbi:MAG: histone deacetylase [Planctomycetota bacterium]
MKTHLVYSDIYLEHDTGEHPENAERLRRTVAYLKKTKLWEKLSLLAPRPATVDEIAYVHNPFYIKMLKDFCESGQHYLDADTAVSFRSYDAALAAAGGLLTAVDAVIAAANSNGLCLVRPPGHHATKNHAMGFCLFNNAAIAARYAQKKHGLKKVAIIDWDLHHGNGTQEAFYEDDSVMFFSMHRSPYYPGSGDAEEVGKGPGVGYTINMPLSFDVSTAEYLEEFREVLDSHIRTFKPELILISAGFDSYKNDPLGGLGLDIADYGELTRAVKSLAKDVCKGRIVSTLEGGYNLNDLPLCIEAHLAALME